MNSHTDHATTNPQTMTRQPFEHVSDGVFAVVLAAGQGGEAEEAGEVAGLVFLSCAQVAVVVHPGDIAFDDPSVGSESVGGFGFLAGIRGVMPRSRSHHRRVAVVVALFGVHSAATLAPVDRV
jgi:hypothetical protein